MPLLVHLCVVCLLNRIAMLIFSYTERKVRYKLFTENTNRFLFLSDSSLSRILSNSLLISFPLSLLSTQPSSTGSSPSAFSPDNSTWPHSPIPRFSFYRVERSTLLRKSSYRFDPSSIFPRIPAGFIRSLKRAAKSGPVRFRAIAQLSFKKVGSQSCVMIFTTTCPKFFACISWLGNKNPFNCRDSRGFPSKRRCRPCDPTGNRLLSRIWAFHFLDGNWMWRSTIFTWRNRHKIWQSGSTKTQIGHRIRSKIFSFSAQFETPEIGTISDLCFSIEPAASSAPGDPADHVRFHRIEEGELTQIHSLLQSAIRQWQVDSLFPLLDLLSSRTQCSFSFD